MGQLVQTHVARYYGARICGTPIKEAGDNAAYQFAYDLSRYGPLLKHASFSEEAEWRLVSRQIGVGEPEIRYRAGSRSVTPFVSFKLQMPGVDAPLAVPKDPNRSISTVVGPTLDEHAQFAIQSLMRTYFGDGCWHGSSNCSFRA